MNARRAAHLTRSQYASLVIDQVRQVQALMDVGLVTPVYFINGKVTTRP